MSRSRLTPESSARTVLEALQAGRPEEAERLCRDFLAADPGSVEHLRLCGHALMQQRRFDEAESTFRAAIQLAPDYAPLAEDLGSALALQNRHDEAIPLFEQAVRQDPRLANAGRKLEHARKTVERSKVTLPPIRTNPDAVIRKEAIGEDNHCVIVDDFLQNPRALAEFAVDHAAGFSASKSYYPGLFFDVNDDAMQDIYRFIRHELAAYFPLRSHDLKLSSFLSMITFPPEQLSIVQRLCHTDPAPGVGRKPYAALLYLFDNEELGGTGFFRYCDNYELLKEAENIGAENPDEGMRFLETHFETFRKPARYMTDSNDIAELLCTIPARFNRLIFYSGEIPHSAAIEAPDLLSKDLSKGRLTLNIFADALAQ